MDRRSTLRPRGVEKIPETSDPKIDKSQICSSVEPFKVLWKSISSSKASKAEINMAWTSVAGRMLLPDSLCRKMFCNVKQNVRRSVYKAIAAGATNCEDIKQHMEKNTGSRSTVPVILETYTWLVEELIREVLNREKRNSTPEEVPHPKKGANRRRQDNLDGPPAKKARELVANSELHQNEYSVLTGAAVDGIRSLPNQLATLMDVKENYDSEQYGRAGPPVGETHFTGDISGLSRLHTQQSENTPRFLSKDCINAVFTDLMGNVSHPFAEILWEKISRFLCF